MSRLENRYQNTFLQSVNTIVTNNPNGWYNIGDISQANFCIVYSVAIDNVNNLVYVGGDFSRAGDVSARNLAVYNASSGSWSEVGGGTDYAVTRLAVDLSQNIYLAGDFEKVGPNNTPINNFAKYYPRTNTWQDMSANGTVTGKPLGIAVDLSNNVYIVGNTFTGRMQKFLYATNSYVTPQPFGVFNSQVQSVDVDLSNNVYIGGGFDTINGINYGRVAKWNVVNDVSGLWAPPLGSNPGIGGGNIVSTVVDLSNNVYFGGNFIDISLNNQKNNFIAKWIPTANNWSAPLGSIGLNDQVRAIAVDSSNNIYVVGLFTQAEGILVNYLARYNSVSGWSDVSSGLFTGSDAYIVDVDNNRNVYVGGYFERVGPSGSINADYIAKWYPNNFNTFNNQSIYTFFNKKFFEYSPRIRL